jgi:DNA-binding GntR family transcriptional regulator
VNYDIYSELKRRIVFLEYRPHEILFVKTLAKEFGVSPIPIRESLILLMSENLVRIIPNRGIYVTEVSFQELKDVFEVRHYLIGLAGRLAAQRISDQELVEIKNLFRKLKNEKDRKRIIQLDAEFHNLINNATKNKTLAEELERMRNRIERLWFFARENEDYSKQIPRNFEMIIEALEKRNAEQCAQMLRNHAIHFINQIKQNLYVEAEK